MLGPAPGPAWSQLGDQFWGQLGNQPEDQLWDQLGGQLQGQLEDQIGEPIADQLGEQLGDLLRDQIEGQLRDQLEGQIGGHLRDQLRGQLGRWLWGELWDQLWYSLGPWDEDCYIASCQCAIQIARLQAEPRLDALASAMRSAGWMIPMRGVMIAGTRPVVISREGPQGRLHNAAGPALAWADGYTLHAWHGTRVPASLIEGDWSTEQALAEPNAEIRRCAIEKLGWDRFEAHLTKVAEAPDPGNPGQVLTLYDLPARLAGMYHAPARLLLCANGTPEPDGTRRRYGLPVPARHTDPVEAAADLYGWTAQDYRQLQVRR